MAIVTTTVSVNAAFLQEIKQDNQELHRLLTQVQELCSKQKPAPGCRQEFADLLSKLRDQLAMHFALEEAYGYFEDSLIIDPRLSRRAERLRTQHASLFSKFCRIVDEAMQMLENRSPRSVCRRIASRFEEFHSALQLHEQQENELIIEAFEQDVGVGD
jgi:hypothetical protein